LADNKFIIAEDAAEVLKWPSTASVVRTWIELVEAHQGDWITEAEFGEMQKALGTKAGVKGKELFQGLRVAVIGKPHGTEMKLLVPLLKKSSLVLRARQVLEKC
jgi:nondiscriminating glutamyl-tRNA synthetase